MNLIDRMQIIIATNDLRKKYSFVVSKLEHDSYAIVYSYGGISRYLDKEFMNLLLSFNKDDKKTLKRLTNIFKVSFSYGKLELEKDSIIIFNTPTKARVALRNFLFWAHRGYEKTIDNYIIYKIMPF